MKKIAILLIAILGLTGCQASDTSSDGLVISQAENARMEARAMQIEETEQTMDPRIEETVESGWYIYDLNDIQINVSDPEFLKVTEFAVVPNSSSVTISYSDPKDETATIIFKTPISMKFTDSFENKGVFSTLGNGGVGASGLDVSSKHYTVTLEFAERDDVTIEITLP